MPRPNPYVRPLTCPLLRHILPPQIFLRVSEESTPFRTAINMENAGIGYRDGDVVMDGRREPRTSRPIVTRAFAGRGIELEPRDWQVVPFIGNVHLPPETQGTRGDDLA